jgi:hypothetical protein
LPAGSQKKAIELLCNNNSVSDLLTVDRTIDGVDWVTKRNAAINSRTEGNIAKRGKGYRKYIYGNFHTFNGNLNAFLCFAEKERLREKERHQIFNHNCLHFTFGFREEKKN